MGIVLCSFLAVKIMGAQLPRDVRWRHMIGTGCLGGIGFTMSLFISGLSFQTPHFAEYARLGILAASLAGGVAGYLILRTRH
jgi:NhaA family Na+:H+ antiporter